MLFLCVDFFLEDWFEVFAGASFGGSRQVFGTGVDDVITLRDGLNGRALRVA